MHRLTPLALGSTGETEVAGSLAGHFGWLDWGVMLGYLAAVTVAGLILSGRQQTMADFFRGGNRLPWWAVTASIMATIISAVTFVTVPSRAFREDGDFTYLQLGIIGGLIARLFVAFVLVPAYLKYKVYSPYDYMAQRLGESARTVTTACFTLMGVLGQSARVYLTAAVLELVLFEPLQNFQALSGVSPIAASILAVGLVAIVWTMVGGMATVIWTDAMLFVVFVAGGLVALGVVVSQLDGGLFELISRGREAGKFKLFELETDNALSLTSPYTPLAAFFAVSLGNIGIYGTDQLIAQRIFCCRSKADAQKAMLASYAAELVAALMLLVGVGLWVFYDQHPETLVGDAGRQVAANPDDVFPVFILTQVPAGLSGLIIAGIFAAAVSSLTSILAALSQTTLSAVVLPLRRRRDDGEADDGSSRGLVRIGRLLVVGWGVVLTAAAFGVDAYIRHQRTRGNDVPFLDLALGLSGYVTGTLLAAFLLAWLPFNRNAYGLLFAAPLSVAAVWAARFHGSLSASEANSLTTTQVTIAAGGLLLGAWVVAALSTRDVNLRRRRLSKTGWIVLGGALLVLLTRYAWFDAGLDRGTGETIRLAIAWPWYTPLGAAVALGFGLLLGDRRDA
jgi:Na+/proline symporter